MSEKTPETKTLKEKLAFYGISIRPHESFRLAVLRIDGFFEFKRQHRDDLKIYKYAIMNITAEIGAQAYRVETIDIGEDSVLLLLQEAAGGGEVEEADLANLLRQMQSNVKDLLKIGLSVSFSRRESDFACLAALSGQVLEASLYRIFYGYGAIIRAQDVLSRKDKSYAFPVPKEKKLMDALLAGKVEEAKRLYSDIVNETADYSVDVIQLAVSHLILTVDTAMQTIRKNSAAPLEFELDTSILTATPFETLEEIHTRFFSLFEEIGRKLAEKRSLKQEDLVLKINELIRQNYADPNLCLNWIADEMDMSPVYLSRIYKQLTMKAMVDCINEVRVERARELLEQTDDSIAVIAEKTGFTNSSYFYRLFKKVHGATPTDYRRRTKFRQEGV